MATFQTLPGFREFYPEECALRNFLFERFRRTALSFAFEEYDAPILEQTELFTAKSGDEIIAQLFNFEDKGGRRVAMRPEMTPSLARMVGTRANAMKRPIKWFNISEAFRYERPQRGRLRSFYQFNADMFGDMSPCADAEIIALCIHALRNFGLSCEDFHVRLSDRRLWTLLLQSHGAGDAEMQQILSLIDRIEREDPGHTIENLGKVRGIDAEKVYGDILLLKNVRTLDQLVKFFEKSSAAGDVIGERIGDFSTLLGRMEAFGLSKFVTIDFSIVRGLAYYTGFVFEAFERTGQSRALAGGGRYDNLTKKLGYSDLPAVGFAAGDVTIGNILMEKKTAPIFSKNLCCFIVYSRETEKIAMKQAAHLRWKNVNVDYCLEESNFVKQLKTAAQHKAKFVAIFDEENAASNRVRMKNMETGSENIISSGDIFAAISE
ncbi:MAG: histidine--tRNA ligase [Puniceicoccales bacterium]|jgi:histidyl-tRNA synthetase|nr:histidine--tRNA ligase [Puniceicoccales bacterium]